jgi:hypothetical protein
LINLSDTSFTGREGAHEALFPSAGDYRDKPCGKGYSHPNESINTINKRLILRFLIIFIGVAFISQQQKPATLTEQSP